ncbi:efflux RND transporter periplasmic adaptor subunit [Bradymonas sediminis]|uniref:Efflux RND transporter periplasmic adaptor subunit n=2 Tax=Bradymonas sediminis TaxID=1548548 RepID=A0A2Z4FR63_9DELT|nr:efflux RND transporter periplasmic adaptor subunit [Bradymonas sediminis]
MCTKCHPELVDGYKEAGDWCDEHGFPESVCPQCHPMQAPQTGATAHSADNGEWCAGHGLPESHCTKCHPELIPKFKEAGDWCDEHGFPESACPVCNPMTPPGAKTATAHSSDNGEWCAGHGLPESHCTKCHPELIPKFKEAGDWCDEHGFPESACPVCNPMTPPGGVAPIEGVEPGTKIIFRQDDHEKAVGIEVVAARQASVGMGITAPARIEFNQNHLADVRAPVPGIVHDVRVDFGETIEKGAPLFVLESAQVGGTQAKIQAANQEIATARANLERQEKLRETGLAAERQVELARRDLQAAQSNLGSLNNALRLAGASGAARSGRYTLRAPISGTIIARPGVVGAFATEETSLATVADTSSMWAMIDVAERDGFALKTGQSVTVTIPGATDAKFPGKITWISPAVNPRTRTITVRAEVKNPDASLRANQFATAEIGIAPDASGVVVPRSAVQRLGGGTVVFVRLSQGQYEPRVVEVDRSDGDLVQVRGTVTPGEPVVTTGAYILKTELSRDSIGAGCCEVPGE